MARPSKLSPAQWQEVARRHAAGEGVRALAREFGVDESSVRAKVNPHTPQVRAVAQKLAAAQTELAALPVPQQYAAVSLAERLRNISASLASAAELGSATAHRLHALANSEVAKVDDAEPMASIDSLRNVGVLTKLANDSSHIALNLLAANKARVEKLEDAGEQPHMIRIVHE
jgi:pyruvate/2-oxoglutarate dehydrogenase complex dihydrolipoamide acyltransferase (E2) component